MPFKYCPECGTAVEPGGRFCESCGQPVAKASAGSGPLPLAGLVSLIALLVLGGGFWLYFRLAPEQPRPLKPGERPPGAMASAPAGAPGQGAPHPPLELPEDIKSYMEGLQTEADANPEDKDKWRTLAGVYYRASRLDPSYGARATAAFEHLVELDENDKDGLRGLGNLAYDRQDRPAAIEYYEKYLTVAPDDSEVRTDLGTMYYESGDAERAVAEYERVLKQNPSFYQAYFNLAVVHDAAGDREKAHGSLAKARDLASEPAVKERIGALLQMAQSENLALTDAAARLASAPTPAGAGMGAGAPAGAPPGASGAAAAGATAGATAPADTFEGAVEQVFRGHPIAGPKVVSIDFPEGANPQVTMASFPMDQMPEVMKVSFLGKMAQGVKAAQEKFGVDGPVVVELVDHSTGKVMATVDPTGDPS